MRRIHSIEAREDLVSVAFEDDNGEIHRFLFRHHDKPFPHMTDDDGPPFTEWVGAGRACPREIYQAIGAFFDARKLSI